MGWLIRYLGNTPCPGCALLFQLERRGGLLDSGEKPAILLRIQLHQAIGISAACLADQLPCSPQRCFSCAPWLPRRYFIRMFLSTPFPRVCFFPGPHLCKKEHESSFRIGVSLSCVTSRAYPGPECQMGYLLVAWVAWN